MLGVIKDHPEIEDIILPVGEAPLELPTEDHFTHIVADTVLAVNDEHYIVIYLGTGREKGVKTHYVLVYLSLHKNIETNWEDIAWVSKWKKKYL